MIQLDEAKCSCYGLCVQRKALHPVTDIPIIISCEDRKIPDGQAYVDIDSPFRPVRIFTAAEWGKKDILRSLKPRDVRFLGDCWLLRRAYNSKDQLAVQPSWERLYPFLIGRELWDEGKFDSLPEQQRMANIVGRSLAVQERQGIISWLPVVVSQALRDVRLVLWWFEKVEKFMPAIFCPDLKTAIFVKGLLGEIRCCPRCEKLFVPRNSNVDYCSPAHRDAHRVARWRAQIAMKRMAAKKKKRRKE